MLLLLLLLPLVGHCQAANSMSAATAAGVAASSLAAQHWLMWLTLTSARQTGAQS